MAGLAEAAGCRADEDERTVPLQLTQEASGCQEGRREVGIERRPPALERQVPDRHVR